MFKFPEKTRFGRSVPKSLIYANAHPSRRIKGLFVAEVDEILWRHKLSPETLNLPARDGYAEIQVFDVILRGDNFSSEVLRTIDRAIPYPVFFRLVRDGRVRYAAAYKRPAQDGSDKWVTGEAFETDWIDGVMPPERPLPVALDLKQLYERMLRALIALPVREGESLDALVTREYAIRRTRRQLEQLESRLRKAKQYSRKVEINAQIRDHKAELAELTDGTD